MEEMEVRNWVDSLALNARHVSGICWRLFCISLYFGDPVVLFFFFWKVKEIS